MSIKGLKSCLENEHKRIEKLYIAKKFSLWFSFIFCQNVIFSTTKKTEIWSWFSSLTKKGPMRRRFLWLMKSRWVFFLFTESVDVIRQAILVHFEIIKEMLMVRNDGWQTAILYQSIRKQTNPDRLRKTGQFSMTTYGYILDTFCQSYSFLTERTKWKVGRILLGDMIMSNI